MIVTECTATVDVTTSESTAQWRCLARRGMLYSECESVDYLSLDGQAVLRFAPLNGVDESVLVVRGSGTFTHDDGYEQTLTERSLVLAPYGVTGLISASEAGLDLLCVRTLARQLSDALPPRVPEVAG